jgi:hypothetical protein
VWVERFGSAPTVYLTIRNETDTTRTCALRVDVRALGFTSNPGVDVLLGPEAVPVGSDVIELAVEGRRTAVIRLEASV